MARAVRDHLADALSTLPALLERMHPPSLHFYFANLYGVRKVIYPALLDAYNHWVRTGQADTLEEQVHIGKQHWQRVATDILDRHHSGEMTVANIIETLIDQNHL